MNKQMEKNKTLLWGYAVIGTLILIIFLACMGFSLQAKASTETTGREKIVSSVCVEEGDTLWSIAALYYTDEYADVNELIKDIKNCNGCSDHIRIGQKLLIPHYRQL